MYVGLRRIVYVQELNVREDVISRSTVKKVFGLRSAVYVSMRAQNKAILGWKTSF